MKPRRRLTEEQRRALLKDYRDGMPGDEITRKWGVGPTYARVLARRRGVSRQQDGRREYR